MIDGTSTIAPLLLADIGVPEMGMVFIVALLLFGGKNMPHLARTLGRAMREFKKASAEIEREIKNAMDEETPKPKALPPPTNSDPDDESNYYHEESSYEETYPPEANPPETSALPDPLPKTETSDSTGTSTDQPAPPPATTPSPDPQTHSDTTPTDPYADSSPPQTETPEKSP